MSILDTLLLPFVTGFHVNIAEDGTFHQDGFVTSQQLFMIMASIGFAVAMGEYLANDQSITVQHYHVDIILTVYMILGCVIMLCFLCCGCAKPAKPAQSGARKIKDLMKSVLQDHVHGIGLAVFFLLGLFHDIADTVAKFACADVYLRCGALLAHTTEIAFRLTRVLFVATEMIFCIKFHKERFPGNCKVRYSLFTILGATISIWFHSVLNESVEHFKCKEQDESDIYKCLINVTNAEEVNNTVECLTESTPLHRSLDKLGPYFYPVHIEFALLVCEILVHLYFTVEPTEHNIEPRAVPEQAADADLPVVARPPNVADRELDPLLQEAAEEGGSAMTIGLVTFVFSLLLLVLDITFAAFTSFDNRGGEEDDDDSCGPLFLPPYYPQMNTTFAQNLTLSNISGSNINYEIGTNNTATDFLVHYSWRYTYEVYQVFYMCVIIVVMMVGYHSVADFVSCSRRREEHSYSGLEQLLVLSTLGFYVWSMLSLIATTAVLNGTHNHNEESLRSELPLGMAQTTFARQFLNLLEVLLQTPFVLHFSKIRSSDTGSTSAILARNGVLFLAITNLCLWVTESFVQMSNDDLEPINNFYYSETMWIIITHIAGPFILFYRFTSAILLFKIWMAELP